MKKNTKKTTRVELFEALTPEQTSQNVRRLFHSSSFESDPIFSYCFPFSPPSDDSRYDY